MTTGRAEKANEETSVRDAGAAGEAVCLGAPEAPPPPCSRSTATTSTTSAVSFASLTNSNRTHSLYKNLLHSIATTEIDIIGTYVRWAFSMALATPCQHPSTMTALRSTVETMTMRARNIHTTSSRVAFLLRVSLATVPATTTLFKQSQRERERERERNYAIV